MDVVNNRIRNEDLVRRLYNHVLTPLKPTVFVNPTNLDTITTHVTEDNFKAVISYFTGKEDHK